MAVSLPSKSRTAALPSFGPRVVPAQRASMIQTRGRVQNSWDGCGGGGSQGEFVDDTRSPTSLENSSFGIASLLQLPSQILHSSSLQIERGAELVDQLAHELTEQLLDSEGDDESHLNARHDAAFSLVDGLKDLSAAITHRLHQQHRRDDTQSISNVWTDRIRGLAKPSHRFGRDNASVSVVTAESTHTKESHKAQAEYQTWDLLKRVLDIRRPPRQSDGSHVNDSIRNFLRTRPAVNRYTDEPELWECFLLQDASAREKKVVLDWLEQHASTLDHLDAIVDQIGERIGKPGLIWNAGSQSSRSMIKSEKLKRRITTALESTNLRTSSSDSSLVSQLDPDATTRQKKCLEGDDQQYDRALWMTCYAMIRQGKPWQSIRAFFDTQGEGWRIASLGMAADEQQSRTSLGGLQAGFLWRQVCLAAAHHVDYDAYKRAVYGLVAGDVQSVDPVCRSFDDLLHVRYNALLLRSFDSYLQAQVPDKYTGSTGQIFPTLPSTVLDEAAEAELAEYINRIMQQPASSASINDPYKILQAAIIADDFETLITHLGIIIGHRANQTSESRLLPPLKELEYDKKYECLADDFDVIRIIVHIFAIYEYAGYDFPEPFRSDVVEYVVVAYIDYLRLQRKIEAIPTYAALLSLDRRHRTLGIICVDIVDEAEQKQLIRLIADQDVNMAQVVTEQYMYAATLMGCLSDDWQPIPAFDLLENTEASLWPGWRIRRDFQPNELSFAEDRLVRSVTWYMHIDSTWRDTFYGLSYAMRLFLLSGMFSGALQVTKVIPYKTMSLKRSPEILGRATCVFSENTLERRPQPPPQMLRRSTRTLSRQLEEITASTEEVPEEESFRLQMMQSQGRQYAEMQQICLALEQLSFWKDFEQVLLKKDFTLEMKKELSEMLRELSLSMQPFLHGFMTRLDNAEDEVYYVKIRQLYVPSILVAYASAQTFAANYLGPEVLTSVYEIATSLASDENKELAQDFVKLGKMKDFVATMARTSKTLLKLNQKRLIAGKKKTSNRSRFWDGATVDIWDPTVII